MKWVDGTESQKKIDIALSASKSLVMNFMFYLIAKTMLFLISEKNSYLAIIVKTQTFKKWGNVFKLSYSIIDKCSKLRKSVSYYNIVYSVH